MDIASKILKLKKIKKAIILSHYYQISDIQDIADFIGDSLGLAHKAMESDAEIIVFAGVRFMAETAKILNPNIKVLIPDVQAGCSLADSCQPEEFKKFIEHYPNHLVITYINSSSIIKMMSDIICTSGNAIPIIESFPKDQRIIFGPDKNLGGYINRKTGRNMVLWNGTCEIHDILSTGKIIELKIKNPNAKLIAHPECKAQVLELADFVGSTNAMLNFSKTDSAKQYIVATETGIIHQMKKASPHKDFIIVPSDETCACNDCPYMKMNTMEKLMRCLEKESPEIILSEDILKKALKPIEKMMEISRELNMIK
ncbi:MAG: quinolinate synthase NadA [Bacteroidetes bacterium]|nr:quinolinate synthase NadA [Bacteroidota bacterium]